MPKDHDLAEVVSHLHQQVGQLHVEINALSDLIEDLSGAIRYCTNNLLDDRFLSDVIAQFQRVVDQSSIEQNSAEGIAIKHFCPSRSDTRRAGSGYAPGRAAVDSPIFSVVDTRCARMSVGGMAVRDEFEPAHHAALPGRNRGL